MSEFTKDMRAIDEWGIATGEAILKGLPLPELRLPSNQKQENQKQDDKSFSAVIE